MIAIFKDHRAGFLETLARRLLFQPVITVLISQYLLPLSPSDSPNLLSKPRV